MGNGYKLNQKNEESDSEDKSDNSTPDFACNKYTTKTTKINGFFYNMKNFFPKLFLKIFVTKNLSK